MKTLSVLVALVLSTSAFAFDKSLLAPFTGKYVIDLTTCNDKIRDYKRAYAHYSKRPDYESFDINVYGDDATMWSIYLTPKTKKFPNGSRQTLKPYLKDNKLGHVSIVVDASGRKSIEDVHVEIVEDGLIYQETYTDFLGGKTIDNCHLIKVIK